MRRKRRTTHSVKTRSGPGRREPFGAPLAAIKVVGIGGGGSNAISRMNRDFIRGVEFIAINTDHQDLDHCAVRRKVYIGKNLTRGLGTGMNPELGRQAAEENRSEIAEAVKGADLVFIAAGLGGGTGGGASSVVAEVAKQSGALTLAFVTKPFTFEGSQRQRIAEEALVKLKDKVDALIVVPNDRIFSIIKKDTPLLKAFAAIDDVLKNALSGIVELIVTPGIINIDFADVRAVVQDSGSAIVGVGVAAGEGRAANAVNSALRSPLIEMSPEGAHGVLLSISGSRDMRMNEVHEIAKVVNQTVDPGARIIFGAYHDRRLKAKQLKVTLIATGFNGQSGAPSLFSARFGDAKDGFLGGRKGVYDDAKVSADEKTDRSLRSESDDPLRKPAGGEGGLEAKAEKPKPKKNESDAWDIPTFLRRRKR